MYKNVRVFVVGCPIRAQLISACHPWVVVPDGLSQSLHSLAGHKSPEICLYLNDEGNLVGAMESLEVLTKVVRLNIIRIDFALAAASHCLSHF